MKSKKIFIYGVNVLLILALLCPLAGQMKGMKFRNINIPYTLKHKDTVLEKGEYNLEVTMPETASVRVFYLRILKGNEALCILNGTKVHYKTEKVSELHKDPNIPDKPRLTMRKMKGLKKIYIYFESGKKSPDYPFEKIKFVVDYIEE